MRIHWQENARRWHGAPKTAFPRFEAWRSEEYAEDPWCLDMFRSPNAKAIKVRHLESLDAAKAFAQGLLAEFDYVAERDLSVAVAADRGQRRTGSLAVVRPRPQVT